MTKAGARTRVGLIWGKLANHLASLIPRKSDLPKHQSCTFCFDKEVTVITFS